MTYDDLKAREAAKCQEAASLYANAAAQQVASASATQRPIMPQLTNSLEQIEKLASMTSDLASRIGRSQPQIGQLLASNGTAAAPADLRSLATAIEHALTRVESNVTRALSSL